jgi:hypothetical protein
MDSGSFLHWLNTTAINRRSNTLTIVLIVDQQDVIYHIYDKNAPKSIFLHYCPINLRSLLRSLNYAWMNFYKQFAPTEFNWKSPVRDALFVDSNYKLKMSPIRGDLYMNINK